MAKRLYIREHMDRMGLSVRRLAERMEFAPGEELMSYGTVQRIVGGKQSPTLEQLEALAAALNTDAWSLCNVNPLIEGEVIDLLRSLSPRKREEAVQILKIMNGGPTDSPAPKDKSEAA